MSADPGEQKSKSIYGRLVLDVECSLPPRPPRSSNNSLVVPQHLHRPANAAAYHPLRGTNGSPSCTVRDTQNSR